MTYGIEYQLQEMIEREIPGTFVIDVYEKEGKDTPNSFDLVYQDGCIVIDGKKYKPFDIWHEKKDRAYLRGKWIYNDSTEDESMIIGFDMNENEVVTSIEQYECRDLGKTYSNRLGTVSLLFNSRFEDGTLCGRYVGDWDPCEPERITLAELEWRMHLYFEEMEDDE